METPVLLLVYNRPNQTEQVLRRLVSCGVSKIYVSADGPKDPQDRILTDEVNAVLEKHSGVIQSKRFSDSHLGCKIAVTTGINWFFEQVEEGIILEDDCLPSDHFFPFMQDLLTRYRENENIWMISGNNPLGKWTTESGHFFSRFGHIWGWATWKNRWQNFDVNLPDLNSFIDDSGFEKQFGPTALAQFRMDQTLLSTQGKMDTWDHQWNTHILMNNGLAVNPEQNLVENIGFEVDATNDHGLPNWVNNEVSQAPISISERLTQPELEYEMEWFLARLTNSPALQSSAEFGLMAKKAQRELTVVLINTTDVGGGAERIAFNVHQNLIGKGIRSILLVEHKKSNIDSVFQIDDWKAQIQNIKPDVIHVHNLHGTSIQLNEIAEVSIRIPVLFTLHDTWLAGGSNSHPFQYDHSELNLLDLRIWNTEFEQRNAVVKTSKIRFTAPSQWIRELFTRKHGIRPFYVPNAVEEVMEKAFDIPSERFILFVANQPETNPYKDFATLKNAWIKLNQELLDEGVDLIVIGGNQSTEKHGNWHIHHVGKCIASEVQFYLKQAKLLVQASKQDNAPLTVLEAHSVGTKVVGSLVGGIPELLSNDEKKWLFESADENQLFASLKTALKSTETLVQNHATEDEMVNVYLGHYYDLVSA
jgi:glycosyltransferase involved in cell wall biosynthesis